MTQVVVTADGRGFRTEAWAGRHTIVADEPVDFGGTDAGPSPYELILASLGACTAMTLYLYAGRKGWPLGGVEIRLSHERIHEQDCENCEEGARLDFIRKEIVLAGALQPEQIARLARVAEKCPVNQTLRAGVRTEQEVRLADAP